MQFIYKLFSVTFQTQFSYKHFGARNAFYPRRNVSRVPQVQKDWQLRGAAEFNVNESVGDFIAEKGECYKLNWYLELKL